MAFWTRLLPLLALIAVLATQDSLGQFLCGRYLTDKLMEVCSEQRRDTQNIEESLGNEELSYRLQDMKKRGIVEECCNRVCTVEQLRKYCWF